MWEWMGAAVRWNQLVLIVGSELEECYGSIAFGVDGRQSKRRTEDEELHRLIR
jgi:hypothetical protein